MIVGYARTSTWDQTGGLAAQQGDQKAAAYAFRHEQLPRTEERISTQRTLQVRASMLLILGERCGPYYAVFRISLYELRASVAACAIAKRSKNKAEAVDHPTQG